MLSKDSRIDFLFKKRLKIFSIGLSMEKNLLIPQLQPQASM